MYNPTPSPTVGQFSDASQIDGGELPSPDVRRFEACQTTRRWGTQTRNRARQSLNTPVITTIEMTSSATGSDTEGLRRGRMFMSSREILVWYDGEMRLESSNIILAQRSCIDPNLAQSQPNNFWHSICPMLEGTKVVDQGSLQTLPTIRAAKRRSQKRAPEGEKKMSSLFSNPKPTN